MSERVRSASGKPRVSATDRLAALAESLDVSLDWLLGTYSELDTPGQVSKEMLEDMQLLAEARRLGLNLRQLVVETRQQRWIEENRGALADANAFLDRHGLWSDGKRQF